VPSRVWKSVLQPQHVAFESSSFAHAGKGSEGLWAIFSHPQIMTQTPSWRLPTTTAV